jgi:hypothetical protein
LVQQVRLVAKKQRRGQLVELLVAVMVLAVGSQERVAVVQVVLVQVLAGEQVARPLLLILLLRLLVLVPFSISFSFSSYQIIPQLHNRG